MLKTVWLTEQRNTVQGTAMLLGGFDGLHAGHRLLLARAKAENLPVGVMTIVGGKEESLFTFSERERIFQEAGIDFVFELPFAEIKDCSAEDFLSILTQEFSPRLFVCGEDFRFGKQALGTPEQIKQSTHVRVEVLSLLKIDDEKVSARRIKTLLEKGEIERANQLLQRPFFMEGKVVKDRQIGREIGFPTANIFYPDGKFPLKKGVYETRICVNGVTYQGITNYGARPTFADETVVTETYLDGFAGDLYEQNLTVEFVRYLRDVQKFDDIEDLKRQLQQDIAVIRTSQNG